MIRTTSEEHDGIPTGVIADSFYDDGKFGFGKDHSGMLFQIDMFDREYYISTAGDVINRMPDAFVEIILDLAFPYMRAGEYERAASCVLDSSTIFLLLNDSPSETVDEPEHHEDENEAKGEENE